MSFKITYFPLFGRAEFIRAMFYHKGVNFENEEIQLADWPAAKPDTARFPLGSMPVVVMDGQQMCQSKAAARAIVTAAIAVTMSSHTRGTMP